MGPFLYQISVIFLRLTRLSTRQRYEPIKGVFHTATTRTSVLITSVPNMQSQGGQGEDCYIWWFVFFFFLLLGTDKECGIWAGKAHLCRHDMSRCWGRPRFVPLCLNVNKMLCWVVTEINTKGATQSRYSTKKMLLIRSNRNAFKKNCLLVCCIILLFIGRKKTSHGDTWQIGEKREKCVRIIFVFTYCTRYLI